MLATHTHFHDFAHALTHPKQQAHYEFAELATFILHGESWDVPREALRVAYDRLQASARRNPNAARLLADVDAKLKAAR